ncbi:DNA recombination and repair protein RecA-like ATP-binding domain [Arabidopsis thaliana x Arabidopsis arenosa]|uniref:DNA repair protein XRCC2 homolog n=3 Tax=Arabidopsis TaxID=3701 RepID=XRCC2_ARATH|nr:homolog of X-ray repair cross complementing 2 (XRCC2) [Arabidopsis thaliana]Q682D3.2 RecName: Full=DNA repair protein XRCC2 homolog; AltName: Full=X-ray repair cross-complementing protein 2 homolog; Short=AtXRCC2 [Arabidopsis thaliana]KAG7607273.1 DNA recombination and repair protein RecA-like ATP-binding domain [Arabidopsis thaliana x Arabidopsis arenosa]AED97911.1 homolog of X-ray repair cross complementing 2 (XRCC2) [Arabidopsis thaliana]OAO93796.1 XRCC2 [Arabidopsis thaliana]CAD12880.1 |eukprot:NP_851268.1 homolog of X-ray repair cross complementing 2 (XRCC2) [Arabidopsis thaliana]
MGDDEARSWIRGDETAKQMLSRVLKDRAFLLIPPLHRVPLRAGNVVEITGASTSAKTQILIQAAISCILPKTWNGIHYGGLGKLVLFLDLDCRFDVLRLSQMLKHRLLQANWLGNGAWWQLEESNVKSCKSAEEKTKTVFDEELYASCMKRFLYVRCYDSLELLSSLKTLHYRIQQQEACGSQVGVLMIDSIGAFHWTDRLSSSLALETHNRKSLSLTNVVETIVQELKKLLLVHSLVVLATKGTIYEEKYPANENNRKVSSNDHFSGNVASKAQQPPFREFMPSSWQAFVTHKIIIRKSADYQSLQTGQQNLLAYSLEWLQPQLSRIDRFIVDDVRKLTTIKPFYSKLLLIYIVIPASSSHAVWYCHCLVT